jgi:chemotaxis protein MotA
MDLATIVGLALAVLFVLGSILAEGTPLEPFMPWSHAGIPAWLLVVGGTLAATTTTAPLSGILALPRAMMRAVRPGNHNSAIEVVRTIVALSNKARTDGILTLEEMGSSIHDAFMRKGIMLVVDGTPSDVIQSAMRVDIEQLQARHEIQHNVLSQAGGFAPTFGIIGTVSSLIGVLASLDPSAGQEALASSISGAFVATFLGLASANLVYLPLAEKLKENTKHEIAMRHMMVEGILGIQAETNPRVLFEILEGYLKPSERAAARALVEGSERASAPDAA